MPSGSCCALVKVHAGSQMARSSCSRAICKALHELTVPAVDINKVCFIAFCIFKGIVAGVSGVASTCSCYIDCKIALDFYCRIRTAVLFAMVLICAYTCNLYTFGGTCEGYSPCQCSPKNRKIVYFVPAKFLKSRFNLGMS